MDSIAGTGWACLPPPAPVPPLVLTGQPRSGASVAPSAPRCLSPSGLPRLPASCGFAGSATGASVLVFGSRLSQRYGFGALLRSRPLSPDTGVGAELERRTNEHRKPPYAVKAVVVPGGLCSSRVAHGRDVRPVDLQPSVPGPEPPVPSPFVRLLDARGDLVAIAEAAVGGVLHPCVVLV